MSRLAGTSFIFLLICLVGSAQELLNKLNSGYYVNNGSHLLLYEHSQWSMPELEYISNNSTQELEYNPSNSNQELEQLPTRIIGGKRIPCQKAPHMVAIHYYGYFLCGGSMISYNTVITAAHCIIGPVSAYNMRVGSSQQRRGGQYLGVESILVHPNFDENTMRNDLALIYPSTKIKKNRCALPIPLPRSNRRSACFTVTGWGTAQPNAEKVQRYLREADVCGVGQNRCRQQYRVQGIVIYSGMFCAASPGRDSCEGDSGGPLVNKRDGTLSGMVSYGVGCANANYPGVYTRVYQYRNWINRNVKK